MIDLQTDMTVTVDMYARMYMFPSGICRAHLYNFSSADRRLDRLDRPASGPPTFNQPTSLNHFPEVRIEVVILRPAQHQRAGLAVEQNEIGNRMRGPVPLCVGDQHFEASLHHRMLSDVGDGNELVSRGPMEP